MIKLLSPALISKNAARLSRLSVLKSPLTPSECCSGALFHLHLGHTPEPILVNLIPMLFGDIWKLKASCIQEMFTC